MKKSVFLFSIFLAVICGTAMAQYDAPLYTSYTTKAAREKMNELVIKNIITKSLTYPLTEDAEESWQDAFNAMEVFHFSTPFTISKVEEAFENVAGRSLNFKRALLEVVYTLYPGQFSESVFNLMKETYNPRIFAMGAEYLMLTEKDQHLVVQVPALMTKIFNEDVAVDPTLFMLSKRLEPTDKNSLKIEEVLREILGKNFLPGKTVMFSFQRPNRDYPGLAIFRNAAGNFIEDSTGSIIAIPQLARSITNLPFYVRNGNTPQGIYSMYGFGVSMSNFIGPTANVQMGMPFELSKTKFFNNNTPDSEWTIENYKAILPRKLQNYFPLFGSFYAGMIGRNEIIVHGTTVEPELYATKPYYPLTPTMGCLTTKEIWNGRRLESDQQALVNALLKAGGARGFTVVLEIDDKEEAVSIEELLPFLIP